MSLGGLTSLESSVFSLLLSWGLIQCWKTLRERVNMPFTLPWHAVSKSYHWENHLLSALSTAHVRYLDRGLCNFQLAGTACLWTRTLFVFGNPCTLSGSKTSTVASPAVVWRNTLKSLLRVHLVGLVLLKYFILLHFPLLSDSVWNALMAVYLWEWLFWCACECCES